MLQWFQHGYDHFPLHQVSFKHIHAMTQAQLDTITNNDIFLIQQDECGLTPLHIVRTNPHATITIIR